MGGEIDEYEYTRLLTEARERATQSMVQRAEELGANAIVGACFTTAAVVGGASEILAYGTALVVEGK